MYNMYYIYSQEDDIIFRMGYILFFFQTFNCSVWNEYIFIVIRDIFVIDNNCDYNCDWERYWERDRMIDTDIDACIYRYRYADIDIDRQIKEHTYI